MRPLPDKAASLIKDVLRGARYRLRHGMRVGSAAVAFAPGAPDFARLTDTVLSVTERTANRILQRPRLELVESGSVIGAYAAMLAETDAAERRRLFVRLQYRLIELVLHRLGVENQYVSEQEIALGYDVLRRRHRPILATLTSARDVTVGHAARFWITAALVQSARQPLREVDLPRRAGPETRCLEQAPAIYCLLIVALTGAILTTLATTEDDDLDMSVDSAIAVVTARFDAWRALSARPKAIELLAREFVAVLPFLP